MQSLFPRFLTPRPLQSSIIIRQAPLLILRQHRFNPSPHFP